MTRAFELTKEDVTNITTLMRRGQKDFSWDEDYFLKVIGESKTKMSVYWAVIALRNCGSARAVDALKLLRNHPSMDVKACAMLTIACIAGQAETPYYAACLGDPTYKAKVYALWAIGKVGDGRAMEAVEAYVRKNKAKLAIATIDPREQQEVLAYLFRMAETSETAKLLLVKFSFLGAALNNALQKLPPLARQNFIARAVGIESVLRYT
jgi:HEAT repeat protein